MVSMQLTEDEAKEYASIETKPGDGPRYPYGLCLYLNDDTLKKLGMEGLPAVGATFTLTAKVVCTSVGMSQQVDGDAENRADMQITDMDLGVSSASPDARKFFASSGMAP